MLKKIAIFLVAAVGILLVMIATRPSTFHIERTQTINAPADVVFAQVTDFHNWAAWSPWEKLDPSMKKTFTGPKAGPGAGYSWSSENKNVGEGRMTISDQETDKRISIKLEFIKPMQVTDVATFTFMPAGNATTVTWAMDGANDFIMKAVSMFMDMDKMLGDDFENGLAALKSVSEGVAKEQAAVAEQAAHAAQVPADGGVAAKDAGK